MRTKTVFGSHANLAHVWAQQNVGYGKSADGRMSFEGATIYSYGYHFPIARFVERKGRKCVLFTTQSYSVSTAKHIGHVRSALRGLAVPVFKVHDVRDNPKQSLKERQTAIDELADAFSRSTPYDDVSHALGRICHPELTKPQPKKDVSNAPT